MNEQQLTLKDWETLYNMVVASQRRESELEKKIAQLEAQLSQAQPVNLPKTGLLSQSLLTRMVTVFFYVLISYFAISLFVYIPYFLSYLLVYWWVIPIIIVIIIIVRWVVKLASYPSDDSSRELVSDMAARYNLMRR